jgi:lactate dehydrogenase-like 2-hydroxyacid dehydrogenase
MSAPTDLDLQDARSPAPAVVAVSRASLPGDGVGRLAERFPLRVWDEPRPPSSDELAVLIGEATALLCLNGDPVSEDVLDRCGSLELVALASVGYNTVDITAAAARGISVTNTPGVLHEATADLAFALILAARRRVAEGDRYVRAGLWTRNDLGTLVGHDVHGATLGIVGMGEIGKAVARRGLGFGMKVVHHTRARSEDDPGWRTLDDLLAEADVVSIHIPLTPETAGLIGERELRLMKPTATLVNTARGGVVDEVSLVTALREGWIHSAGIDVQTTEPNPSRTSPLLELDNLVVLPHIGSASKTARAAMIGLAVDNIVAHLDGRPLLSPIPTGGAARP